MITASPPRYYQAVTSTRTLLVTTCALLVPSVFSRWARADAHVRLYYAAPEPCPTEADFLAAVTARGGRFDAAEAASGTRQMKVSILRGARGFEGSLTLEGEEGASGDREVHAAECAEVTDGLAVVATIALKGAAQLAATVPVQPEASAPAQNAALGARVVETEPAKDDATPRMRAHSFKLDERVQVPAGTVRFDRIDSWTLSAGAQFGLLPGVAMPRYELTGTVAHFVTPPAADSYLVGPILQAFWTWMGPATRHAEGFATQANAIAAGVRSCSAFTYDTQGLVFLGCGEFGIGWMNLTTKDDRGYKDSKNTGFGTAGLLLDAQYNLGALLHLGIRGGAQIQLGGVSADRPDGSELFKAPMLGGFAVAGFGLHF